MPTSRPDGADLIDQLTAAAASAIKNETPSLLRGPGTVRGLTVELHISGSGKVIETVAYVERRAPYTGPHPVRFTEAP